jgi:O-antigen/teichoic acid export membrane protein
MSGANKGPAAPAFEVGDPLAKMPPPSRRRAALASAAFAYAGLTVVLVQGFVLTPAYLAHIPVALYGAWLAAGNVIAWIELVDPGLAGLMQQRVAFAFGRRDSGQLGTVIATGLLVVAAFSVLPLVAWPAASGVGTLLHLEGVQVDELATSFRIGLVASSINLAAYGVSGINVGLQRTTMYGSSTLVAACCGIVFTLALLISGAGLSSIPGGLVARGLVVFSWNTVALWTWCRRYLPNRLHLEWQEARAIAQLSSFGVLGRVGATLLQKMDVFLGAQLVAPSSAAVFTLTGRSLDLVRLGADRIGGAVTGSLSHLAGEGKAERVRQVVSLLMATVSWAGGIGAGLVLAFNAVFVGLWVGPEFYGGNMLTLGVSAAMAVGLMTNLLALLTYALGAVRACSLVVLCEAVVRVPLQVVLTREIGLGGLPLAAIITGLTISMILLPLLASKLIGAQPRQVLRQAWCRLAYMALIGVCGIPLRWLIEMANIAWTWPRMAAGLLAVAIVLAVTIFATDAASREAVSSVQRYLAARGGRPK